MLFYYSSLSRPKLLGHTHFTGSAVGAEHWKVLNVLMVALDLNTTQDSRVVCARRQRQALVWLSGPAPHWLHVPAEHLNLGQSELRFAVTGKHTVDFSHMVQKENVNISLNFIFILNSVVPGNQKPQRRWVVGTRCSVTEVDQMPGWSLGVRWWDPESWPVWNRSGGSGGTN